MSNWISEFNAVFFISLATILTGSFALLMKYCLKSKCESISVCFGLFNINRRVDLEVQQELAQMELGITSEDDIKITDNSPKPKLPLNIKSKKSPYIENKIDI